jgi:hypothetical protein
VGFPEVPHSFWWYARTAPGTISWPLAILLVAAVVWALLRLDLPRAVLVTTLASGYVGLNLYFALSWWYAAALLPVAATLIALAVTAARPRWLRGALVIACALAAGFNLVVVTWGLPPGTHRVAESLGAPLGSATCRMRSSAAFCPQPARRDHWPIAEVITATMDDCGSAFDRPCQLMVVPSHLLHRRLVNYHLASAFPGAELEVVQNRSQKFTEQPYDLSALLDSDYILVHWRTSDAHRTDPPPNHFEATRRFLLTPPPLFAAAHQRVATFEFPFPGSREVRLLRRVHPLTTAEALEAIAELQVSERAKRTQRALLRRLSRQEAAAADRADNPDGS